MMAYFDLSIKKIVPLLIIGAILVSIVSMTFLWKQQAYGQTRFINALQLSAEKVYTYASFALYYVARSGSQAAFALLPFTEEGAAATKEDRAARAIPVLTYHRLERNTDNANVTVANFMDQMQTLKNNGWETITLKEYNAFMRGEIELPERSFLITFDDGAKESYYPVDPIFHVLGYNGVQYIIVEASRVPGSTYYLSEVEIKNMLETGRWEIGSHSLDAHRKYPVDESGETGIFYSDKLWVAEEGRLETTAEFRARVQEDLKRSREELEKTYGHTIDTFAFPFGGEVGHTAAQNFSDGESITIAEASNVYSLGWMQNEDGEDFTPNYPHQSTFIQKRIHVDHDWSGARLLRELENGLPKDLPFVDDMLANLGWLPSWGNVQAGGILYLSALPGESSASSLLDGSLLWDDYEYTATLDWDTSYVMLLADATHSKTYRSCVFFDGKVQIQDTQDGNTTTLATANYPRITHGSGVRGTIRTEGGTITCLWNGSEVLVARGQPDQAGGIGLQTWDPSLGTAEVTATRIDVRDL